MIRVALVSSPACSSSSTFYPETISWECSSVFRGMNSTTRHSWTHCEPRPHRFLCWTARRLESLCVLVDADIEPTANARGIVPRRRGRSARLSLRSGALRFEPLQRHPKGSHFVLHQVPKDVLVHAEIAVDQQVSKADEFTPFDLWRPGADLLG